MRIIAGKLRHRVIKETNLDTTRETQDKVRGAIFNVIGQFFTSGNCLDLFAGSGAMAIEAYSRGIDNIYLNDINSKACSIIKSNLDSLKIENYKIFNLDYQTCLSELSQIKFDLIILDPPYSMNDIDGIIDLISKYDMLNIKGKIVFEMAKESHYSKSIGKYYASKEKFYGIKKVIVYEVIE